MKRYVDASFFALLIAWLTQVGVYSLMPLSTPSSTKPEILSVAVAFGIFSVIANLLFVQLPSAYVTKVFFKTNAIQFALLSSAYGVILLTVTLFWPASSSFSQSLPLFASAAINGFTYGLAFHLIWKPASISE